MERRFKTVEEFERFFAHGLDMDDEMTSWIRKNQEAKNICDRRYYAWCDAHNVPETYEAMLFAIEDFYADLEKKSDRDEYDEWNLRCWKQQLNGEIPDPFIPMEEDDESLE